MSFLGLDQHDLPLFVCEFLTVEEIFRGDSNDVFYG